MAATDLVYNTVDPVLFTPDYSFLRYTLDKSQARYDQGLDAVSKSYNNLKKKLYDPTNIERRDQFLKDAQGQLQKIASSDLSLPQNISAANNVFDPLATNSAFIYDAYQTNRIDKALDEMKSWSESEDMETRKKFNPKIYDWVASQIDVLKEGKGDINNYKKMPNRSAFAAVDAQDIVNKALRDAGGTFSRDIDGGVYVYGTENGVSFKKNYDEFARTALNNNPVYRQMNDILGESDYESLVKQGKLSGKNDEQALSEFAISNYGAIKTSSSKYIDGIKTDLEKQKKDLIAQNQSGKLTDQEFLTRTKELESNISQYNELKSNFNNQFGEDDKTAEEKKNTYLTNFLSNPKGFLSNQYLDNDVNTFSNIKSSFEKTTIKPNTAYFQSLNAVNDSQRTKNDILKGIQTLEIKEEDQDLKERKQDWLEAGKPVTGKSFGTSGGAMETVTTINPDGTITSSKKPKKPELTYVGYSATDINKTLNTLNTISTQIDLNTSKSIDMLASAADGGAISLLNTTFGVKRENVQVVREFFIKQQAAVIKDPSKPYKPNSEESKALNDVYSSLFSFAKLNGEETVLQKLRENSGKKAEDIDFHGLLDLAFSQTKFKDAKDVGHYNQWMEHNKANENITSLSNILKASKAAVIASKKDDPEFSGIFVDRGTKEKPDLDIINKDDIKGWLSGKNNPYGTQEQSKVNSLIFGNMNAGKGINSGTGVDDKTLDALSEGFINGTLKFSDTHIGLKTGDPFSPILQKALNIGHYLIGDKTAEDKINRDADGNIVTQVTYNGKNYILPKLPITQEKYQELSNRINSDVQLPDIDPNFKQQLMASPIWNLGGGLKDAVIIPLAAGPTQYSSNIVKSVDGNNFEQVDDAEEQTKLRGAMMDPKNIAENGVNVHSKSNSNRGGLAVAVTFAAADTKEEKEECVYCGQTIYFPIDASKGTPDVLAAYNTINDQTEYNRLKNTGQTFDIYNFDAMGIKVQALPHTKGSNSGDVIFTIQKQDPITKEFIPGEYETIQDTYTTETQTYDDIKAEIYNKVVSPFIINRISLEKQKAKTAGAAIDRNKLLKELVLPQ